MSRIVTLLTDFGLSDTYVGQMKGAILRVAPSAQLIDLTHQVPPQDVRAGAFLLWTAVETFPPRSVHLAVVDPGVGTARRAVALLTPRGDLLVGPDNGLLAPAADRLGGVAEVAVLDRERFHGPARSTTFHGRDIFGPVAGHLASGAWLTEIGSLTSSTEIERPFNFSPPPAGPPIQARVVHVDSYGNLITDVPAALLPPHFEVEIGFRHIRGPVGSYQSVAHGEPLAIVGSCGLLEISVRDGNAALALGIGRDALVTVQPLK